MLAFLWLELGPLGGEQAILTDLLHYCVRPALRLFAGTMLLLCRPAFRMLLYNWRNRRAPSAAGEASHGSWGFQSCGLELSAMCALSVDQGIYCLSLSFFPGCNYAASRGLKGPPRSGRSHYPGPIPDSLSVLCKVSSYAGLSFPVCQMEITVYIIGLS